MENNLLENTYESRNFITKFYFRTKVWLAIKLAKIEKTDVILDFGCGGGWLEKKLKDYQIYGYDINPKKTFIKNYKKVKPDFIFILDVLEHIPATEIEKVINNLKKLNNGFKLIVSAPTENEISKRIRKFVGKSEIPTEHITKYKDILKILNKNFKLIKKVNFFTVSHIFLFEYTKFKNNLLHKLL
jgi:2-polyprenyl-3-methyl-5-hydroxy-6-metoxy-1,4-benzoquinol methylase